VSSARTWWKSTLDGIIQAMELDDGHVAGEPVDEGVDTCDVVEAERVGNTSRRNRV
jgi:hypothetical protein